MVVNKVIVLIEIGGEDVGWADNAIESVNVFGLYSE